MKTTHTKYYSWLICSLLAGLWVFSGSCTSYKRITYMQDVPQAAEGRPVQEVASGRDTFESIRIQTGDQLQVSIHTLDAQLNSILNQSSESIGATASNAGVLVDEKGEIALPIIGKVKVGGLTTAAARDTIDSVSKKYLKDPIVNVRISNFKITVIGEVSKPSQYIIPDEKVNILDAIGLAGDLTVYGKRNNVMLIRHNQNDKKYVRIDLASSQFTNSPYFYLKQGDLLYVEPVKLRSILINPRVRDIAIISSAVTVLALLLNISRK